MRNGKFELLIVRVINDKNLNNFKLHSNFYFILTNVNDKLFYFFLENTALVKNIELSTNSNK